MLRLRSSAWVVLRTLKPARRSQTARNQAGTNTSFAPLKQIDAGLLNVGYAEAGPADGPAVLLLHGWPYDIHSFVDVAPLLASAGYRVIVPYLRGYGTTRFLSGDTMRNGQPSVVALDTIALMDALKIERRSWPVSIGALARPILSPRFGPSAARVRTPVVAPLQAPDCPITSKPEASSLRLSSHQSITARTLSPIAAAQRLFAPVVRTQSASAANSVLDGVPITLGSAAATAVHPADVRPEPPRSVL